MPWTVDNPPRPAKNWSLSEKRKCVVAANFVLKKGGSDQDAIFACIRAAGKSTKVKKKKERGKGQGTNGPKQGDGGADMCVCPKCGSHTTHEKGIPCTDVKCSKCGSQMIGVNTVTATKEDGKYKIISISTAALKDREGEVFGIPAIDYDIEQAKSTGVYPEFRVFHSPHLGVGRVTSMRRVGIFAIDEGYSYTDPFSLGVCKDLYEDTSGKWRVSKGFRVVEVSGACPNCGESLLIRKEHIVFGFKCPSCAAIHLGYKDVLGDVTYLKARTFDVTFTDIPSVPWTSVSAYRASLEDSVMTRKELRKRLVDAGLPEDMVDDKLATISDAQLKELKDDVPDAVLKELTETEEEDNGEYIDFDEAILKEFSDIVDERVKEVVKEVVGGMLSELTLEVPDVELDIPQLKEFGDALKELTDKVDALNEDDDERFSKRKKEMPRGARFRIRRFKSSKGEDDDEDDEEDEEDFEEEKELGIVGGDGAHAGSMTEFLQGEG